MASLENVYMEDPVRSNSLLRVDLIFCETENISCLIFAVYLNDLEQEMENRNCRGISVSDRNNEYLMLQLFTLLYADDTIILSNTEKDLQYSLQIYAEYCQKWKLIVNIDKSKILVFGKHTKRINFTLNGVELERVKTFKYL